MHRNIVLIGFMATGKTEVAKILSKKLKMDCVSVDDVIEQKAEMKIKDIFAELGEEKFRDMETNILKTLIGTKNNVISCGGGIVIRQENRRYLKQTGKVFLLTANPETINKRLKDLTERPLLAIKDEKERMKKIRQILRSREKAYKESADVTISTDKLTVEEVADKIMTNYK